MREYETTTKEKPTKNDRMTNDHVAIQLPNGLQISPITIQVDP
jgi:hypothetical protein